MKPIAVATDRRVPERADRRRVVRILAALVGTALLGEPAAAQLRPLPLVHWETAGDVYARCGVGYYSAQRASLAGVAGDMLQLGECSFAVNVGGAQIRLADVTYRRLTTRSRFAEPAPDVVLRGDTVLGDFGDVTIETVIPLNLPGAFAAGFRFGSRIPSSDNRIGLDRDQADIYLAAMLGMNTADRGFSAEAGVGINGVRDNRVEQQDVLIYAVRGWLFSSRMRIPAVVHVAMLGQRYWNHDVTSRGNENLNELRVGGRMGRTWWLEVEGVRGTAAYSPGFGVRVGVGRALR